MTEATIGSPTFPLFSSLPPELRCQIWRDALPSKVAPALYFWRKGCWFPRRLTESEEGFDPVREELNLLFEFRHDLLDATQLKLALVSVNFEARGIALAWAREQGLAIHTSDGSHYPILACPFDHLARDVLYFTYDQWVGCIREQYDRMFEPDLVERNLDMRIEISRIAVSEEVLRQSEFNILAEIFEQFFLVEVIFVICGAQPASQFVDSMVRVQQRWEFENAQGGAFFWNRDRHGFDFRDGERMSVYEPVYKLIEEASEELVTDLTRSQIRTLEIRLAGAIKV